MFTAKRFDEREMEEETDTTGDKSAICIVLWDICGRCEAHVVPAARTKSTEGMHALLWQITEAVGAGSRFLILRPEVTENTSVKWTSI